uniref:Uncharacterized protein Sho n=1 Tax=Petunia hybrida TaxID=4102 RepID=Q8S533_PETHY|nr:unknown [Petunia x hybrida]
MLIVVHIISITRIIFITLTHNHLHFLMFRSLSYNHKHLKFLTNPTTRVLRRNMSSSTVVTIPGPTQKNKNKIIVIMGATGSGKSKLSIDLVTRHYPFSEIINSDKIQITKGLNITTNKITVPDRRGVVHHLLGEIDPDFNFSPSHFRSIAGQRINSIINRHKLPFLVGGSNSYIYALLTNRFDPDFNPDSNPVHFISNELRYNCCFIWVDVLNPVLNEYLDKRVDEMMNSGMYEELEQFFKENRFSDPGLEPGRATGLRKAIGVPEMERYFKKSCTYEEAVREIKENTWRLAKKQMWKIQRLREAGWDLQRVDATEAFVEAMSNKKEKGIIWEKQVVEPSVKIVNRFLLD